jgi:hypothetical protein
MGQHMSNLNINHFFNSEMPPKITDENYKMKIRVNLEKNRSATLIVGIKSVQVDENDDSGKVQLEWTPKSHLRDFEVLSYDSKEIHIGRWAGIGIIIIESLGTLIRIFYIGTQEDPKLRLDVSAWNHTLEAKEILNSSLSLGYDVLYLSGKSNKVSHLCEEMDERDDQKTLILCVDPKLGEKRKVENEDE